MTEEEWLKSLKAGDEVIVNTHKGFELNVIERITKSGQICLNSGMKFRQSDGKKVGQSDIWHPVSICPVTDKHRETMKRNRMIRNILGTMNKEWLKNINIEQLERISFLIDEIKS